MAPGISLDDDKEWDDRALIDSWDEALDEYNKYHSIQASGKRLEDVLSEDELRELQQDHQGLIDAPAMETVYNPSIANNYADQVQADSSGVTQVSQPAKKAKESAASEQQNEPRTADAVPPLPAVLGNVEDENLKNLMMSWYYAGYYTGVYTGQQKKE